MEDYEEKAIEPQQEATVETVVKFDKTQKTFKEEIEDFQKAEISMDNYHKFADKIKSSMVTLDSHVQKALAAVVKTKTELAHDYKSSDMEDLIAKKLATKDVLDKEVDVRYLFEDLFVWSYLQKKQLALLVGKLLTVLSSYKSMGFDVEVIKAQKEISSASFDRMDKMVDTVDTILTKKIDSVEARIEPRLRRLENLAMNIKEIEVPKPTPEPKPEPVEEKPAEQDKPQPEETEEHEKDLTEDKPKPLW